MTLARVNVPALLALWARGVDALVHADHASPTDADQPAELDLVAVRHEIARRLRQRPASAETRDLLREFDDAFRAVTVESDVCAHGEDAAAAAGWTRRREWYFWRTRRAGHAAPAPTDSESSPERH